MRTTFIQRAYTSTAKHEFSEQQIRDLLVECRINNLIAQITGLLIYGRQTFFQILEGPVDYVDELWLKINQDPRHYNVRQLLSREISRPLFKDWSMAFERLDSPLASQMINLSDLFADQSSQSRSLCTQQEIIALVESFSYNLSKESDSTDVRSVTTVGQ